MPQTKIKFCFVLFNLVGFGRFGWVWLGLVGFGWVGLGLVGFGGVWLSLVGFGWVWLGCPCLVKLSQTSDSMQCNGFGLNLIKNVLGALPDGLGTRRDTTTYEYCG